MEGLLDSGADAILLPKQVAEMIGLEPLNECDLSGITKKGKGYRTKIGFMLGVSKARCYDFGIIDTVFPAEESDIPILIGRTPLFDYFEVVFKQYDEKPKVVLILKK